MARYQPNPARVLPLRGAVDQALRAAAEVVEVDVALRFRKRQHGYTTGAFARPGRGVTAAITRTEPFDHNGGRRVTVGTNSRSDDGYPYPLAWELGHYNIYLRKRIRVETFRPALFDNVTRIVAAYERRYKRFMETGA